ncbi:integrase catalytic domain-containing protein [Trichonephila inaurata madagascariensis]|uniref:Integrase catalytic domain-containing protein n=1 Tax=Trichonephila inaurata madagascariensis TaxID=2747483 RepID=A0A8X6XIH8_9ARAC|nr:integrase catalytic domain-containing protein [Trichonephila inaurata madagascariensis]
MKVVVEDGISKQLETFWQLENLGTEPVNENLTCNDDKILQEFEENIQFRDGRYVVKLPWKDNLKESLDNNYEIAYERFSKLCHKFQNDQSLYTEYKSGADSYVEQNIVERVPNTNVVDGAEFYLPHRAVIWYDRSSSKLRIIFDASSHKRELDDSDKNVTKFFWTDSPESFSESLEVLRFKSFIQNKYSSPFLLTATIKYHLKKYSSLFPQTLELLSKFVFVDDVLGGQSTVASACTTSVECVQIFNEANMPLHKWATNSAELRELWEKNGFSAETSSNSIGQNMINYKMLGISWDTDRDAFYFDIESLLSFISKRTDTKRTRNFISSRGITWKFILERVPWWGGVYESPVKSVKDPLRKILGKALLTFEELTTILVEIEYIVNSRPLTYVMDDFSEPNSLTPLDFLQYGRKNYDYPLHFAELANKVSNRESLIKRKQYQTTLLKHFWNKWKTQYLLDLKTVHHFKSPNIHKDVKIGDVVLVEESLKSKLLWDLGTIQETLMGRDGHIRASIVKTKKGLFRKPVKLIYPFELSE